MGYWKWVSESVGFSLGAGRNQARSAHGNAQWLTGQRVTAEKTRKNAQGRANSVQNGSERVALRTLAQMRFGTGQSPAEAIFHYPISDIRFHGEAPTGTMLAMSDEQTTVSELDRLLAAIRGYDDPRRAAAEWKQVYRLLGKTDTPPGRITGVVGMRDVAALAEIVERLRTPAEARAGADEAEIDADTLRKAVQAFRKRQKLTVLDDESKLGGGALTKGALSREARAIRPPVEWPGAVWRELVRQGRLRYVGHGLYDLPR